MMLGLRDKFAFLQDKPQLWHFTTPDKLAQILYNNRMDSGNVWNSFTRRRDLLWKAPQVGMRFDRDRLRQNYRLEPFNWFSKESPNDFMSRYRQEAEERVKGPIENIDRFLLDIIVPQRAKNEIYDSMDFHKQMINEARRWGHTEEDIDRHKKKWLDLNYVMNHPKVRFVDIAPWNQGPTRKFRPL